jgi:DNA invertase Pin-like site-specific DNA recombinase
LARYADDFTILVKSKRVGCEQIYKDTISGAKTKSVGLSDALAYACEGDTIVVWRLDRLSRSLKDLIEIVAGLETKGISLKSLYETIHTNSSSGKPIFSYFWRTSGMLAAARARGLTGRGGRPVALSDAKKALAIKLYKAKELTV